METAINTNTTIAPKQNILLASFKKAWVDNKKTILMRMAMMSGVWFLIGLICGITIGSSTEFIIIMYFTLSLMAGCIYVSTSFNEMKYKGGRISMLMNPASVTDKYLPRICNAVIGTFLIMILSYIMLELGRMLGWLFVQHGTPSFMLPWQVLSVGENLNILLTLGWILMGIGLFFYGAILWPRKSFIKTAGVLILVQTLLMICTFWILDMIIDGGYMVEWLLDKVQTAWLIFSIEICIGGLCAVLAFVRLKKSTILYRLKQ